MAGYGADMFFVNNKGGSFVAAKYLTDKNGNYVIYPLDVTQNPIFTKYILDANGNHIKDPQSPASGTQPYIVPADYDPQKTIDKYSSLYWNTPPAFRTPVIFQQLHIKGVTHQRGQTPLIFFNGVAA